MARKSKSITRVRRAAGMFDVSHMLAIDVHGAGARDFLAYVLANNVHRLRDCRQGVVLVPARIPQAGYIDDLIVYFFAEDWFRLVVNAGTADKDCAWLMAQRDERVPQLVITPRRDLAIIAVQGPQARAKVYAALPGPQAAGEQLVYFSAAHVGDHRAGAHRLHGRRRL